MKQMNFLNNLVFNFIGVNSKNFGIHSNKIKDFGVNPKFLMKLKLH